IRIRIEAGADALIRRRERLAAVFAQIVTTGRNTEMYATAVANDRVHAESATARRPLAGVIVVADPGHDLPRVAAVAAPEQRRGLDAGPDFLLPRPGLDRPDVCERASVVFVERGGRFGLLEGLAQVRRAKQLHPEERVAARRIHARRAAR